MAFPARLLHPGEEVVADVRPHWWYLAAPVAISVVAVAGAAVTGASAVPKAGDWVMASVLAAVLAWLVVRYLRWRGTRVVVTTSRLVHRQGVLARRSREIPLAHLGDIGYRQSVWQRLLGAGDLLVEPAGSDSREVIPWLPHPGAIEHEIYLRIVATRSSIPSVAGELERLDGLRRRGVLTEMEFDEQKARVLRR